MTFGEKLRQSRTAKKMTQKQLADLVGAKHNSVSDWENNKNKPDPDTIELLCGVLEITPNFLLNTNSESFSFLEKELIRKYQSLDTDGKETVDFILNKEYKRCSLMDYAVINPDGSHLTIEMQRANRILNAAHAIDGSSEKDQQHDEDIMNGEDF